MFTLSIILFIIFDTLIRYEPDSNLKKLWIKKIPNSIVKKIESFFTRLMNKMTERMMNQQNIPKNDSIKFADNIFSIFEDVIRTIPSKYAIRILVFSFFCLVFSLADFVYNLVVYYIPHYLEIFNYIFN